MNGSAAFRADGQVVHGRAGFLVDEFQLIHGREEFAAFGTGLHFKGAAPDGAFVAGRGHLDMAGRADISAGAAADADIRFFIIRRPYFFVGAAGK